MFVDDFVDDGLVQPVNVLFTAAHASKGGPVLLARSLHAGAGAPGAGSVAIRLTSLYSRYRNGPGPPA